MQKELCIILLIVLIRLTGFELVYGDNNDKDPFGFEFENWDRTSSKWLIKNDNTEIEIDKSICKSGNSSLKIKALKCEGVINVNCSNVSLRQLFVLPKDSSEVCFGIHILGDQTWDVNINLFGFNSKDSMTFSKVHKANLSDSWTEEKFCFNNDNFMSLIIELEFIGLAENITEKQPTLWIDEAFLTINGESITYSEELSDLPDSFKYQGVLSTFDEIEYADFNNIEGLDNSRLIAIGETVHGSITFQKAAYDMIKWMILNNEVRFVLLEVPMDLALLWDLYISGSNNIIIDNYMPIGGLLDVTELKFFLRWLKKYNLENKERIRIIGIDSPGIYIEDFYFARYLQTLGNSPVLDLLVRETTKQFIGVSPEAYQYLLANENTLLNYFNTDDFKCFKYALKKSSLRREVNVNYKNNRELDIASAVEFVHDSLFRNGDKAVIYSHWTHVSKSQFKLDPKLKSSGTYLFEKYKEEYFSIALLAYEGNLSAYSGDTLLLNHKLELPPDNSLEAYCHNIKKGNLIYTLSKDSKLFKSFRFGGNELNYGVFNHTYLINAMDAFIYFDDLESITVNTKGLNLKSEMNKLVIGNRIMNFNEFVNQ